MTLLHLNGVSFRALSQKYEVSTGTAYSRVSEVLKELPHCADISRKYCTRFCGILLVDGKYVAVKGYDRKIPRKYNRDDFWKRAHHITKYYEEDTRCLSLMIDIQKRYDLLFAYQKMKHVPRTTNLIESFNSHLQGRLKTIKGFETFHHADDWLNGYFLHRRLKRFTDSEGKFRYLNGNSSLSKSIKTKVLFDNLSQISR